MVFSKFLHFAKIFFAFRIFALSQKIFCEKVRKIRPKIFVFFRKRFVRWKVKRPKINPLVAIYDLYNNLKIYQTYQLITHWLKPWTWKKIESLKTLVSEL